jgi:cytochrome c-type biogenesis protein
MPTELYGTVVFALGAGTATFFAPCVYALLPGYVGYYAATVDGESVPLSGAFVRGLAATVGAIGTFAVLSMLALGAGELLERALPVIEPLVGLALVALGLVTLWRGSLSLHVALPERRASVLGFGLFGALYALAATACVLPLFLAVAIQSVALSPGASVLVLAAYAGSFAALVLAATVAVAIGHDALAGRLRPHGATLSRLAGVVLVLAGVGQMYLAVTL